MTPLDLKQLDETISLFSKRDANGFETGDYQALFIAARRYRAIAPLLERMMGEETSAYMRNNYISEIAKIMGEPA